MEIVIILIFVAIVAVAAIYVFSREKINLRKAADGEDRERLRKAVAQALPEENGYQLVYGHYEKVQHYGRKTLTTYYYYALAFDTGRIWVMPLVFDKERIIPGEPVLITADTLGVADISIRNDKEGKVRRVDCTFYDKNGKSFLDCVVEVNNTREDSYHHVNIVQEEECARFARLIGPMAEQVNRDNAALQAQVHTSGASARKASILGTIGIFFSIVFPPIGIVLGIIGLRHAKRGRTGKEITVPMVQCCVALAISVILTLVVGGAFVYSLLVLGRINM